MFEKQTDLKANKKQIKSEKSTVAKFCDAAGILLRSIKGKQILKIGKIVRVVNKKFYQDWIQEFWLIDADY